MCYRKKFKKWETKRDTHHTLLPIYMINPPALSAWQDLETGCKHWPGNACIHLSSYPNWVLTAIFTCGSVVFVEADVNLPLPINGNNPISLRHKAHLYISASSKLVWGPGLENGHDNSYLWVIWVMWFANTKERKMLVFSLDCSQ